VEPVLHRRGDAGLVLAPERVRRGAGSGRRLLAPGPPDRDRAGDPGGRAATEEPSPADPLRQDSTAAVSRPSGSERAFTASDSALTSGLLSSS
jgi:hypothetical protein